MELPKSKSLFLSLSTLLSINLMTACKSISDLQEPSPNAQITSAGSPEATAAAARGYTFNVMAPLTLPQSPEEWSSLSSRLEKIKVLGAYGVSTDVWWGLVEGAKNDVFD